MLSPDIIFRGLKWCLNIFLGSKWQLLSNINAKRWRNLDENILDKMKEFVTNNYTEVPEIEVLEDSYEDQEECNIVLSA